VAIRGDVQMKRLLLIGFTACAFAAMPSFSVSAMPTTLADQLLAGTDSSVILAKAGGAGGGWGRAAVGRPPGWSRGRKVGWRGRGCPPGLWKQGRC
jgi:hypothetical protein